MSVEIYGILLEALTFCLVFAILAFGGRIARKKFLR